MLKKKGRRMNHHYSSVIIFSIFGDKDRWKAILVLMLYPYVLQYLNVFWMWLRRRDKFVLTFKQKYDKGRIVCHNPTYIALCWFCIENHSEKQNFLICEDNSLKKNEKIGFNFRTIPIYTPTTSFSFDYGKEKLEMSFTQTEQEKTISVSSWKNCNILKSFVNEIDSKYQHHFYGSVDTDKLYTFEWNDEGNFEYNEMKIKKNFKNVYLTEKVETGIRNDIDTFFKNKDFYLENGIPYKRGYLLYGCPGGGKNSLVYAIANEYKLNLYKLNYKCDLKHMVSKIPPRSLLFIDEVDMRIYNDRLEANEGKKDEKSEGNEKKDEKNEKKDEKKDEKNEKKDEKKNDTNKIVNKLDKFSLSSLMEILDGYDHLHECIVIMTTNHREVLDPALIRPGRIDLQFQLEEFTAMDIMKTVKKFTGFDIEVRENVKMTSSTLINQILLPHRNDKNKISEMINK